MDAGVPIRVVIVDDEDDMRRLFRLALEYDERFDVVGDAADGESGTSLVRRVAPEAVVLDWAMPRLGGAAAVEAIRGAAPSAKILLVSAYDRGQIEDAARAAGADAFLEKPAAVEVLPAVLLQLCREEVDLRDLGPSAPAPRRDRP